MHHFNALVLLLCAFFVVIVLWSYRRLTRTPFSLENKHVCITGGSQGIGLGVARECLRRGSTTITLLARDISKLKAVITTLREEAAQDSRKSYNIQAFSCDVVDPVAVEEVFALLHGQREFSDHDTPWKLVEDTFTPTPAVDVLFTCAGFCICDSLDRLAPSELQQQIQLNVLGTLYPCHSMMKAVTTSSTLSPRVIVLVGSMASLVNIYGFVGYGASKFAIRGIWEALSMECDPLNICVACAFPPNTDTPGFAIEEIRKPKVTRLIESTPGLWQPDQVASRIVAGVESGKRRITFGITGRLLAALTSGFCPTTDLLEFFTDWAMLPFAKLLAGVLSMYWIDIARKYATPQSSKMKSH